MPFFRMLYSVADLLRGLAGPRRGASFVDCNHDGRQRYFIHAGKGDEFPVRVRDRNRHGFLHLLGFFDNQVERPFGVTVLEVHDVSHGASREHDSAAEAGDQIQNRIG